MNDFPELNSNVRSLMRAEIGAIHYLATFQSLEMKKRTIFIKRSESLRAAVNA